MNLQTNTGYGAWNERTGRVSIELPYTTPTSGSFIMKRIEYQKGDVINGFVFIKEVSRIFPKIRRALFECHCGKEFEREISIVRFGSVKSCGCLRHYYKHGLTYTPVWYLYNSMIARCHNPDRDNYYGYGSRGIKVCEEWRNDIRVFMDYVIKLPHAFGDGYSLDRMNNDGNYEPGNVQWATAHQQAANKSTYKNNKTGITGVFFDKESNKFNANIAVNKKRYYLGYYNSKEGALKARNDYIIKNELWEYPIQEV